MAFDVAADAYGRFMGRFSEPLAERFAEQLDDALTPGARVLDVGCGPGALTQRLVTRLGADAVSAVDPSAPFVEAARHRFPGLDVRQAAAEELPYDDATFDAALAQLVVHFMTDAVAGLREMRRVVRPGGTVAVSVWDYAGGRAPLTTFWRAAADLDPGVVDESGLAGAREGQLADLLQQAGLADVQAGELAVRVPYTSVDEWWEPYTLGVGPAGDHVARLDDDARDALRARCEELLPPAPFEVEAVAWTARGRA